MQLRVIFFNAFPRSGDASRRALSQIAWIKSQQKRAPRPIQAACLRSRDWIKIKNPNAPAVRREAEEEWR